MDRNYKTNAEMPWHLWADGDVDPDDGQAVVLLVEEDTCDEEMHPEIRMAIAERHVAEPWGEHWRFRLLDWDDDTDFTGPIGKPFLNTNVYTVKAWRATTETGR